MNPDQANANTIALVGGKGVQHGSGYFRKPEVLLEDRDAANTRPVVGIVVVIDLVVVILPLVASTIIRGPSLGGRCRRACPILPDPVVDLPLALLARVDVSIFSRQSDDARGAVLGLSGLGAHKFTMYPDVRLDVPFQETLASERRPHRFLDRGRSPGGAAAAPGDQSDILAAQDLYGRIGRRQLIGRLFASLDTQSAGDRLADDARRVVLVEEQTGSESSVDGPDVRRPVTHTLLKRMVVVESRQRR